MNVKEFIELFEEEVRKLYKHPIIVGRKQFEKLNSYEYTYLISIAMYNAVKNYNKKSRNNNNFKKIFIVPEEGKGSRSDFSLKNEKGEVELVIEHENSRGEKIMKNYKKLLTKEKGLLICYESNRHDERHEQFKKDIEKIKKEGKIYLLIGTKKGSNDFSNSMEYKETFDPTKSDSNASKT